MKKKFLALLLALATAFSLAVPAFAAVSSNFDDVPESHWAYYSINWCADFGFVNGVGNRRFAPENTLRRAVFGDDCPCLLQR